MPGIIDLLGRTLVTATPQQRVREVAELMATHNIGALPVVAGDRLVGIVSERDIIARVVAVGADPQATTVEAVMTKSPATVEADAAPARALELMNQKKCRHLPVLRGGKLAGMISLRDLLQARLATQESELQVMAALPERQFE